MIGKHTFKISVKSVGKSTIMDVVYVFRDEQGEHFKDSSWIGKVESGKFIDAFCEAIKGTDDGPLRAFVPHVNLDDAEQRESLRQFIASHTDDSGFWPMPKGVACNGVGK